jgi:hypothetical protein
MRSEKGTTMAFWGTLDCVDRKKHLLELGHPENEIKKELCNNTVDNGVPSKTLTADSQVDVGRISRSSMGWNPSWFSFIKSQFKYQLGSFPSLFPYKDSRQNSVDDKKLPPWKVHLHGIWPRRWSYLLLWLNPIFRHVPQHNLSLMNNVKQDPVLLPISKDIVASCEAFGILNNPDHWTLHGCVLLSNLNPLLFKMKEPIGRNCGKELTSDSRGIDQEQSS